MHWWDEQRDYGWRGHWRREHCCRMSFVKAGFHGEKRQLLMGTPPALYAVLVTTSYTGNG